MADRVTLAHATNRAFPPSIPVTHLAQPGGGAAHAFTLRSQHAEGLKQVVVAWGREILPGRNRNLWRKGFWGIADQALISAAHFITTILVARVISPREFGLYALAYTGLVFLNTVQSALVTEPHTTLGAPLTGTRYVAYTTDTGWTQVLLCIASALLVLAIAVPATIRGWWVAPVILALAPATVAWQLQTYLRRAMYTRSQVLQAFINDLLSYGGHIIIVAGLWWTGTLTPVRSLIALAATSALGTFLGLWQLRRHLDRTFNRERIRPTAQANWSFGKWLLGEHISYWTSGQIYPVLAAGLVSVTATGALRAIETIMGPTNVLRIALDPLFAPRAARTYARGGTPALLRLIRRLQVLNVIAIGTYCITVMMFAGPIMRFVYGDAYGPYGWVLALVSMITLVNALRSPIRIGLKTLGQTNAVFRTNLAASIADLTLGLALVYLMGFTGIAIGLVLNMLVLQATTWYFWHKATTNEGTSSSRATGSVAQPVDIREGWTA